MYKKNKALMITGWIILGSGMLALMAAVTMWLWNWLVPGLFGLPAITFLQSAGLLALIKILTGIAGSGSHRWGGHHNKHRMWKQKWDNKMACMSEDEKEAFKEMYYKRCGRKPAGSAETKDEALT
jgi:hypothetical protein